MKTEIKMPDLGTNQAEVKVLKWLVEVGDTVSRGDPLLEVETDKAATEVESFASGVLVETRVAPDDEVIAGTVIAIIETSE